MANVLNSEELKTEAKKELGEDEARVKVILLIMQALFLAIMMMPLFDF